MRVFLSSYLWGNKPGLLFDMLGDNKHVGLITNSSDQFPENGVIERLNQDQRYLQDRGLSSERIDLREYFNNNGLESKINKYGLIWVIGGNVFVLRRAFAQSGFDQLLSKLLDKDQIVYGGYSAGACVMGTTLRGLDLVDDAKIAPPGYNPDTIWEGLGIVPYAIAPHFKSDHPETELVSKSIDYFEKHSIAFQALRDGQAIVINGRQNDVVS